MHIASVSSSSTCGNAYLAWGDSSRPVLVDCGVSIKKVVCALRTLGMEPGDLAGLFITHEHSDHVRSICLKTPLAEKFGIPVYASAGFWQWWEYNVPCRLDPSLRRVMAPFETVQLEGIEVQAFPKPHDAAEPLGFVVESGGEKAGFAMDLGHVPARIEGVLSGLTHLVFESNHDVTMEKESGRPYFLIRRVLGDLGHLSNDQAAESLARLVTVHTKQVVLAHLSIDCNTPSLAVGAVKEALSLAGRRASVFAAPAGDLAVYES